MKNQKNRNSEKRRAFCVALGGIFTALGVVIMYAGSLIEVLDLTAAVIASLLCIVTVIDLGKRWAWVVYAATSVLATVLLPNKFPAIMYLLFFGFYPIIKEKLEKLSNKIVQWALKELIFNVCLILLMVIGSYVLMIDMKAWFTMEVIFFLLANGTFVMYDIALTRIISLYVFKLRKKLRIK